MSKEPTKYKAGMDIAGAKTVAILESIFKSKRVQCPCCGRKYITGGCYECPKCMHYWDERDPDGWDLHLRDLAECETGKSAGTKHDNGKLDWSLMDFDLMAPLIPVLVLGEERYNFENWKKDFGPNAQRRFKAAMLRHIRSAGNNPLAINADDGNVYHYAQIAINALFAIYHAERGPK